MANQKISARTLATPPLTGNEKIPIGVEGDKAINPEMLKNFVIADIGTPASFAETLAGTNNIKTITPLRLRQVNQTVYNVEAYGAVHDGVMDANGLATGTDDTVAIQAAINAAFAAGGGIVYFPNGIYVISGALVTSVDSVNPNCQLYFPLKQTTSSQPSVIPRIYLQGESVGPLFETILVGYEPSSSGVILYSTITGSGTEPSVLASSFYNNGFGNINAVEVDIRNIRIRVKSKTGSTDIAPTMSQFNLRYLSGCVLNDNMADTESQTINSISPAGTGTVGFYLPVISNSGGIVINNCQAAHMNTGFYISEHVTANQIWSNACYVGLALGPSGHASIINRFFANGYVIGIYVPTNSSNPKVLINEFGFERANLAGKWYSTATTTIYEVYADGAAYGTINYFGIASGGGTVVLSTGGIVQTLNLVNLQTRLQQNFGGAGFTTGNGGAAALGSSPFLELYSGDTNPSIISASANQSGTSTAAIGNFHFRNQAATGAEKRAMLLGAYTNGSVDDAILYWYNMIAGALHEIVHIDKNFNFACPPVLPSYADDAAADAASQGGTAPAGTMYYNSSANKMKVKENATWKTVTTS